MTGNIVPDPCNTEPAPLLGCAVDRDGFNYCDEITAREPAIERNRTAGVDTLNLEVATAQMQARHAEEALWRESRSET